MKRTTQGTEVDELDEIRTDALDFAGLRRNLQRALTEKKKWQARARELEAQLPTAPKDPSTRDKFLASAAVRLAGLEGDALAAELVKLEAEMAPLIAAEVGEVQAQHVARIESLSKAYVRVRREQAAQAIAADLARPGAAAVLTPHVLKRIHAEARGDDVELLARDAGGKPMSFEALKQELRSAPGFAPLIAGTTKTEQEAHARKVAESLGQPAPVGPAQGMTSERFDGLTPAARVDYVSQGGRVN